MKTKNILKSLAVAMLMPAMLLTTACSNNDDIVNPTENTINKKGYALPATINVTRQGDNATTRATYNAETKKLSFSSGDKLFVFAFSSPAGRFAGMLTWQSDGTFSGTIITENEYSGTEDELLAATSYPHAYLLPAGYESYGYLTITNSGAYNAGCSGDLTKAITSTKAAAVEQFSFEKADSYSSGFALAPDNAILNFTISGLAANTEIAVSFHDNYAPSNSVNVTTDADGVATFAAGFQGNLKDYTLTVGGNAITLPDKETAAGHIYNISRSVAAPATPYTLAESTVGMVVGTDGKAYAAADKGNLPTGVTAAGMVAYKSGSNGLVIALADEASTMLWDAANGASGAAAHTPTVADQTWKLPSQNEWKQMFQANGGNEGKYTDLNTVITTAGGTALQGEEAKYWSSSSFDEDLHYVVILDAGNATWDTRDNSWYFGRVRACLAF